MLDIVWTCDDVGTEESTEHVLRLSRMLEAAGFRGVFMVVPNFYDTPLEQKPDLCRALEEVRHAGHELALHGYDHYNFEFGIMPDFILGRSADAKNDLARNRVTIDAMHAPPALDRRLDMAISLWEKALSFRPTVFRAPCLSVHANLFPVLKEHGFQCDSSFAVNPTLWRYCDARVPLENEWISPRGPVPYEIVPGLWEFPLIGDYTIQVDDSEVPYLRSVLEEDSRRCERLGAPFVVLVHWWALEKHDRAGYRFWEAQLDRWARRGDVTAYTLSQLRTRYVRDGEKTPSTGREGGGEA